MFNLIIYAKIIYAKHRNNRISKIVELKIS